MKLYKIVSVFLFLFLFVELKAQYDSNYDYTLDWELDGKTGKYKPAYTYKTGKGNSTIWLEGSNKSRKATTKKAGDTSANELKTFVKFTPPANWTVHKNAERALLWYKDGAKITIFKSYAFSGSDRYKDLQEKWISMAKVKYGAQSDKVSSYNFKENGKVLSTVKFMTVKNEIRTCSLVIIYYNDRAFPVLTEFPTEKSLYDHQKAYEKFLTSIDVNKGLIE